MNTDPALFQTAQPFPHVVLDAYCPEALLEAAMPAFQQARFQVFAGENEAGKGQADPPPSATPIFRWMRTLKPWLEGMTGIGGLELDLLGGGLHRTQKGGRLGMHVDFNRHPDTGWYRRLNMLLFANRVYSPLDGGQLWLAERMTEDTYDASLRGPNVDPLWNRLVVFETGEHTWHGHPVPWQQEGYDRLSFAGYWYSEQPPAVKAKEHSTVWA